MRTTAPRPCGVGTLALVARRPRVSGRLVAAVTSVDAAPCLALLLFAVTDVVPLTGPGAAFTTVGSVTVAVFAALESTGPRRSRARR
ncbi:hypothetical protein [Streptomyces sp. Wb2n-11]|uniref:hypothetical protein n=1 Tax=Streptomyces sp. Wb2n-11 TaxID=1030533 RepID=UPI000B89946E|nr:hypothetical protein [Streptomyces sp. Wb2n-11]